MYQQEKKREATQSTSELVRNADQRKTESISPNFGSESDVRTKNARESLKLETRCPPGAFHPEPAFQVSHNDAEGPLEKERTRRECFHGKAELILIISSY